MSDMFCFQCEQTAGGKGCSGAAGACGKSAATAQLQDMLTSALVRVAKAVHLGKTTRTAESDRILLEGLFMTLTNVNFDDQAIEKMIKQVRKLGSGVDASADVYELATLWTADEDVRSLKSLVLFGARGIAAYAYHALLLGYKDERVDQFFYEALAALSEDIAADALIALAMRTGEINLQCMALLEQANTDTYGHPVPTEVEMRIETGPFIVVTGHDLSDLMALLKQTAGRGVAVYTHGEMLPAHAYPKLKEYSQLKGHFGTAWQNQQREFADIPGAVLYTTNCLMPPQKNYQDRLFTTEVVGYAGLRHIGDDKDFTPVIEKALALGGYQEEQLMTGINGGSKLTTGFGKQAVLGVAPQVIDAVKSGKIRHFFLVGGCDGARSGRNYYTQFVKQAPADTVILTLACGKFRFNDLDLGGIAGIPRLLDMGQCNDAYAAIQVALALADAFKCGVNELPLTLVLSWYEQKAVCILLTLLALGIKNIYIGPSLPAFLSPTVLNILVEKFQLTPISTPEADLKKILG